MSLIIQDSIVIAANTTNDDVLSGKRNQLIDPSTGGAICSFYITGSATGLEAEAWVGQRNPMERSAINTQNRMPVVPDDLMVNNVAGLPNEVIRIPVTNTTGGGLTFFYRVEVEEIPRRR